MRRSHADGLMPGRIEIDGDKIRLVVGDVLVHAVAGERDKMAGFFRLERRDDAPDKRTSLFRRGVAFVQERVDDDRRMVD